MNQPIFSFVFPIKGTEFRTKRNFPSIEDATSWAVGILLKEGDDYCHFKEVPSSDYVFDPVNEGHHVISWTDDMPHYDVLHIID